MKNYCGHCKYRDFGLNEDPCRTCWVFDGHSSTYTKYERGPSVKEESECNDDYCEIKFEEE